MKVLGRLSRRTVVQGYVTYDSCKKGRLAPDTQGWDWSSADAIDTALKAAGLKFGIPAAFTEWEFVSLTVDDLRECAVVHTISKDVGSEARDLGRLEAEGRLAGWEPRPARSWYSALKAGHPLSPLEACLLRPTVASERPAKWYLEDGSGRATAIIANAPNFHSAESVAYGFRGTAVDPLSTFMAERFRELLASEGKA